MARIDDMIDEPEHPYLGAEFGRRYVDLSTATNARQVGEYIASNATFRQRQDAQEQVARRTATFLERADGDSPQVVARRGAVRAGGWAARLGEGTTACDPLDA